ncbi:hypothetical protein D1007_18916 [Hordeum vulgare]|nr:hypothetical protein D1007_18916 [Hordeum vulgare]KAI5015760.1 hypothetical protein ZWY2020_057150 [Hordeum vulgare]
MEARLKAVMREMLAAKVSTETTAAPADALLEQHDTTKRVQSQGSVVPEDCVALTMEEYEELSQRVRKTEEAVRRRPRILWRATVLSLPAW